MIGSDTDTDTPIAESDAAAMAVVVDLIGYTDLSPEQAIDYMAVDLGNIPKKEWALIRGKDLDYMHSSLYLARQKIRRATADESNSEGECTNNGHGAAIGGN